MEAVKTHAEFIAEIEELKSQLEEAHDTIEAIRTGEVDAFVVKNGEGHRLYTLKSADHTYRIFIEKMTEGAVTINQDGIILYCNTSFAKMVNRPLTAVLGFNFNDIIPEEYKQKVKQLIANAWNEEQKTEINLTGKNNTPLPVLLSLNSLEIDDGIALSIIVSNLSYQKQTQQQLKQKNKELEEAQMITKHLNARLEQTVQERTNELFESREHFKFLADNIPTIVWTANEKGEIEYFNNRWFEYTGKEKINSINDLQALIHQDDKAAYMELWKNTVISGKAFEMVHRFKKADGEYRWHFSHALPYKNNSNEIVNWFGISTDIDEQQKALEKKDEFISIASHELKTPVTSIKGYVQILRFNFEKEGNINAAALLTKVDSQINKLSVLIGDLLDARKIENGQFQFHETSFDFNEMVNEIVEETGKAVIGRNIICQLEDTKTVKGDRTKIGQVISNFIDNAAKYSSPDTSIFVTTVNSGNTIKLSVQDFGMGITNEHQLKVFDRFFRVTGEKENTYGGLGLGLYISSEIIKRHNGKIGVKSERGKGATFYFELQTTN
jgi:two-component system, OmpR family, phosphate regulon sensor histidine kinase PhoR